MKQPQVFQNRRGERLFAIEELKQDTPLVITLHGFASHKVGSNRSYVKLARALFEADISSCRFDFSGCGDSDGNLEDLSFQDLVDDVLTVYEHFKKRGYQRIGFFGSSLGGTLATVAAERLKTVSSLVLWAPIGQGMSWYTENASQVKTYQGVRVNPLFQEQFKALSLEENLASLGDVPLLHMQGEEDAVVPLTHQETFRRGRERAKAKSCFLTYPSCGHILGFASVFPTVLKTTVNWFKESL